MIDFCIILGVLEKLSGDTLNDKKGRCRITSLLPIKDNRQCRQAAQGQ